MRAELLALALAASSCVAAPPSISPPVDVNAQALAVDAVPASFGALRGILARADIAPDLRRVATRRLIAMLRAAARAGDEDASADALKELRALVHAQPESIELPEVADELVDLLAANGRADEAYGVVRHQVCPTVFPYRAPELDARAPVSNPQDHSLAYWQRWESVHPEPLAAGRARAAKRKGGLKAPQDAPPFDEETRYQSLYEACPPIGGDAAPRWLRVAEYHDEVDLAAGPFRSNRAVEAYRHALLQGDEATSRRARALLGSTLVRRGDRAAGTRELLAYLSACEGGVRVGCDAATLRHAIGLVGQAFTYLDLDGASDAEPEILANDIIDTEPDPRVVERKLRVVVLSRVDDERLLPRRASFAVPVLVATAISLREIALPVLAAEVLERAARLAPNDAGTPGIVAAIGELYAAKAKELRAPQPLPLRVKSADAREAALAMLRPGSPWRSAQPRDAADDPELRGLAADTVAALAKTHVGIAADLEVAAEIERPFPVSLDEALALLARGKRAVDADGATGRVGASADAATARADLEIAEIAVRARLGAAPAPAAWRRVRADVEALLVGADPRAAATAATRRVDLTNHWIAQEQRRFAATNGAEGFRTRSEPGSPVRLGPRVDPLPEAAAEAVAARVAEADVQVRAGSLGTHALLAAASLEIDFGRAPEAAALLDRALGASCRLPMGFMIWRSRVELARAANDRAALAELRAMHLDRDRTCAHSAEETATGRALTR